MPESQSMTRRSAVPVGGTSQRQVLARLLEQKGGMTVDELADSVGISRTAVNQHLLALECDGYIRKDSVRKTGGRPGRAPWPRSGPAAATRWAWWPA